MGIAVSDPLGIIAQPLEFVPAEPLPACLDRLRELLQSKEVGQIIVGLPRNMDGSYGPTAEKVREFVAMLKASVTIPIRTWDERLTTTQAQRIMTDAGVRRQDRKQKVDQMAAAILLQSYLDSQTG